MRILWVKMNGLWPANTGGRVRSLQIISALSRRHRVTLVTTHGSGDDPGGLSRQLPGCHRIYSIPFSVPKRGDSRFPASVARSWFSRDPVDLWKWRVKEVRDIVNRLVDDHTADVCISDFLFAAANVPMRGPIPVVLFEHNVEHLIWQRLSTLETNPARRALFELEWRKLRWRERALCRRADLTITVSGEDRDRLAALAPDARITDIPTGVDTNYFRPTTAPEIPGRLVFTGSMDWQPNEDAVTYFADAILPRIRREVPTVSFAIVGRRPNARVRAVAERAGILVTGTVDDVRPYIAEAAVYVVPLRAGGGTRLKIFEALAMQKPVVSTTVGAEGLALTSGQEFIAADDADTFGREVIALIRDPLRRRNLGRAGRALVDTRYSWPHVAHAFETACEQVVTSHETASTGADDRAHLPRKRFAGFRRARLVVSEHDEFDRTHRHP
jgi:sugar transferase (PEP-CTERM/EpsH1 system associated)